MQETAEHPVYPPPASGGYACAMKRDGTHVVIGSLYAGIFSGVLTGNQLAGSWSIGKNSLPYILVFSSAPKELTLKRTASSASAH